MLNYVRTYAVCIKRNNASAQVSFFPLSRNHFHWKFSLFQQYHLDKIMWKRQYTNHEDHYKKLKKFETGLWGQNGWKLYLQIKSAVARSVEQFWKSARYELGLSICKNRWCSVCECSSRCCLLLFGQLLCLRSQISESPVTSDWKQRVCMVCMDRECSNCYWTTVSVMRCLRLQFSLGLH